MRSIIQNDNHEHITIASSLPLAQHHSAEHRANTLHFFMILAIKNARFCHTLLPDFAIKNCLNLLGKVVGDGGQEHGQQHQTAQGGQNPHEAGDCRSTWIY